MKKILYEDIYASTNQFSFGKNWLSFLQKLDQKKLNQAQEYLQQFMGGKKEIKGRTVVDFGCGSGLMSLCFVLSGAGKVLSVDIDDSSIECAKFLRKKYAIPEDMWEIHKGSILDEGFVGSLGKFDIVYSWGVIHHSGDMWRGLDNIQTLVEENGKLYLALYNKFDGFPSSYLWHKIKSYYSHTNPITKRLLEWVYVVEIVVMRILRGHNPIAYIRQYYENSNRGMDFYTDIKDWLGGYPYEFVSVNEVREFYEPKGFELVNLFDSSAGTGCHEFLFHRKQ